MNPEVGDLRRMLILIALAASIGAAIGTAMPDRIHTWLLATAAGWTALQSDVSWRLERHGRRLGWSRHWQRLGELVVLAAVAKVLHLAGLGWTGAVSELSRWPVSFIEAETMVAWLLMIGIWVAVSLTLTDLAGLGHRGDPLDGQGLPIPNLIRRWTMGGVVLLAAASVGLAGWSGLFTIGRAPLVGLILPGLVYFPLGVVALTQVRLADARGSWARGRYTVDPGVEGRWFATALLGGMAVVAGLLLIPTGDAAPVLTVLAAAVGAVGRFFSAIVGWIEDHAPARTGPRETDVAVPPASLPFDEEPGPPIEPGEPLFSDDTIRLIQRGVFWLVVAAVLGLVIRELYRSRRELRILVREEFRTGGLAAGLRAALAAIPIAFWDALRRLFGRLRRPRGSEEPEGTVHREERVAVSWSEGHPTRSRILALYRRFLAVVGAVIGERRRSETPTEFYGRVQQDAPQIAEPAGVVTVLFEEARYRGGPIDDERVALTEERLEALEALLTGPGEPGD